MKIKKITIKNIKSFKDESVFELLPDFNILIGPNGSGKSNFMDILSVVLREYFIQIYSVQEVQYAPNRTFLTIQSAMQYTTGRSLKKYLEKYVGSESEDSEIKIEFILQQEDIDNMIKIITHIDELLEVLEERYGYNNQHWQYRDKLQLAKEWRGYMSLFIPGDIIPYRIINSELELPDQSEIKARGFLHYVNIFELVSILVRDAEDIFDLHINYMSIGPYRGIDEGNQCATLSSSNQYELISQYMRSTSKDVTNLLAVGVLFFAQKRRMYEGLEAGYISSWTEDQQVCSVSGFLEQIGYEWDMRLQDRSKNIYSIVLKEGGREIHLGQASSGERELLSFLLGIYAYRIAGGIIIVDEPELHLHPKWQRVLLRIFKELARKTNNQFVISTHAPAFVNSDSYQHIHRIYRENSCSKHIYLRIPEALDVKQIHHLINATNNEKIFFADSVVLVEGITDRLIFQKILNLVQQERNSKKIVEIVELKGKYNIECYRIFLEALKMPHFVIADNDYLREIAPESLRTLMKVNLRKIDKDVIKNEGSMDGKQLVEKLDDAIQTGNLEDLRSLWEYIKTIRMEFNQHSLSQTEKEQIEMFISAQEDENVYILKEGAIEAYLPEGFRGKHLEKILEFLNDDDYKEWINDELALELKNIVEKILHKVG